MIIFYPIVVWVDPKIASVFSGVSLFRYYIGQSRQIFRDSFWHRHSDLLCLQPHRGKKIFEDIERRPLRDHRQIPPRIEGADSESRRVGWLFMHFVYILKAKLMNKSYVGHTFDDRRIKRTYPGKHFYTKRYFTRGNYIMKILKTQMSEEKEKIFMNNQWKKVYENIFENL